MLCSEQITLQMKNCCRNPKKKHEKKRHKLLLGEALKQIGMGYHLVMAVLDWAEITPN